MKNNAIRGFANLIGETITKIDATGINCICVETESGKRFVSADAVASELLPEFKIG